MVHQTSSAPYAGSVQELIAQRGALYAFLATLALVPGFAGSGAYLAMLISLPVTLLVFINWRWFNLQDKSFPALFALAYVIFAISVALPGRPAGSAIFVFDFVPLLFAVGLYVGLARIDRERLLVWLAYGCLVGTGLSLAVGTYQTFGLGMGRAQGIGGIAIYYANIALLLGFLALAPLFSRSKWHWPFALAPVFGIAAALMSGSRSVVTVGAALLIVFFLHLLIWNKNNANPRLWRRVAILSASIPVVAIAAILFVDSHQTDRIAAMFSQAQSLLRGDGVGDRSMEYRFDFYISGIRAFLERPILGHGLYQSASAAAPFMQVYDPSSDPEGALRHLHNDVIEFAVALGIPGVIAYLLTMIAPIVTWLKNGQRRADYGSYCVFAVVAAYMAMGLTDINFLIEAPQVLYCFTAAGAAALAARRVTDAS